MTKKEYEELHRVVKDKLGHQLHVDDLVIGYAYNCCVEIYRVKNCVRKKLFLLELQITDGILIFIQIG